MKVTVRFGDTGVVVPCGDGSLLVSQLIDKAVARYKKARGRPNSYWVAVHTLKASGGGILDGDDQLNDVADDNEQLLAVYKEQGGPLLHRNSGDGTSASSVGTSSPNIIPTTLLAVYEEQGGPLLHHNGGDGTSASSVGTSSPDIFQGRNGNEDPEKNGSFRPYLRHEGNKNDVIITQNDLTQGSSLIVRRGSEPVLTNVGTSPAQKKPDLYSISSSTRWGTSEGINEYQPAKGRENGEADDTGNHSRRSSALFGEARTQPNGYENDRSQSDIYGNDRNNANSFETDTNDEITHNDDSIHSNSQSHLHPFSSPYSNAHQQIQHKQQQNPNPNQQTQQHVGRYIKNPQVNTGSRPAGFEPREGGNDPQPEMEELAREGEPEDVEQNNGGARVGVVVGGSNSGMATTGNGSSGGGFDPFARDSTRRSLANNAAMWKWLDAQEKTQDRHEFQQGDRKEPLGSSEDTNDTRNSKMDGTKLVSLPNCNGPLGIHVVPDYDDSGRDMGLVIQGIEPGGRVFQDGRLKVQDRIVEINGQGLIDVDFHKAQEIFKQALHAEELVLRVIGKDAPPLPGIPPPSQRESRLSSSDTSDVTSTAIQIGHGNERGIGISSTSSERNLDSPHQAPKTLQHKERGIGIAAPSPVVTPTTTPPLSPKKTPPPLPARNPNTHLTNSSQSAKAKIIAPTNTKKIGKKINISLTKGSAGLGFSVTTRDNPAGGVPPIYIKKILPSGAAIQDGRLKPGDMLLEVNGTDMVGKTQQDAVSMLRDTPMGGTVTMVISRIVVEDDEEPKSITPKQLSPNRIVSQNSPVQQPPSSHDALQPPDKADDLLTAPNIVPEFLEFDIPLNAAKASGLGVSVKGKTSQQKGQKDLGIFIKDIIDGGAAQQDGRLKINDQLIKVNGDSLLGVTNMIAMDKLRRAMRKPEEDVTDSDVIQLVVARRHLSASSSMRDVRISASDNTEPPAKENPTQDTQSNSNQHEHDLKNGASMDKNANKNNMADLNMGDNIGTGNQLKVKHGVSVFDHVRQRSADGGYQGNHQEAGNIAMRNSGILKPRPASTIGFQTLSGSNPRHTSGYTVDPGEGAPRPPDWLQLELDHKEDPDGLSPTEQAIGFSREGFGRQSMSEKRKGYLDPRLTEFYQKVKNNRETNQYSSETWDPRKSKLVYEGYGMLKRAGSVESLLGSAANTSNMDYNQMHESLPNIGYFKGPPPEFKLPPQYINPFTGKPSEKELGPTLGLKKSSSLESLQTAVQEVVQEEEEQEDGFYRPHTNKGMVRGRGCNESFRAAVDRSYDNQQTDTMATSKSLAVDEELSDAGSNPSGQGRSSRGSSFNDKEDNGKRKKNKKEKSGEKESKSGLFSGFFKFGKNRKVVEDRLPAKTSSEMHKDRLVQHRRDADITLQNKKPEQQTAEEKQKVKDLQQDNQDQTKQNEDQTLKQTNSQSSAHETANQNAAHRRPEEERVLTSSQQYRSESESYAKSTNSNPPGRVEHIQNIRARLQQQHRERNGVYPADAEQEKIEQRIQQIEQHQRLLEEQKKHGLIVPQPRDSSPPTINRKSFVRNEPPPQIAGLDPEMSHYANIHEIRAHLRHHDVMQQEHRSRMLPPSSSAANGAAGGVPMPQRGSMHPPTSTTTPHLSSSMPPPSHLPPRSSHLHHPQHQKHLPPQPKHPAPHPSQQQQHPPLSATNSHPGYSERGFPSVSDFPPGGAGSYQNRLPPSGGRDPRLYNPSASHPSSVNHHYSDPRVQPHNQHHNQPFNDPNRLHSRSADPRQWETSYGRSLTPGPPMRSVTPTPVANPRAHTPVNQIYGSTNQILPPRGHNNGRPPPDLLHSRSEHIMGGSDPRALPHEINYRHNSEYDTNSKTTYARERQMEPPGNMSHSYGSLPRQRDMKEKRYYSHGNLQPSLMSSSAQV